MPLTPTSSVNPVRIGLVRHFEVARSLPTGWCTAQEICHWITDYDQTEILPKEADLGGIPWTRCFSSDMARAHRTAELIYTGPITPLRLLREPGVLPFRTGGLRLPFRLWRTILRLAWMTSHPAQRAMKQEFTARLQEVVQTILIPNAENTLIVSHAGVMYFLRKELKKLGYHGPSYTVAENGKLYLFEKPLEAEK